LIMAALPINEYCWTCAPVQEYVKLSSDYTKDLSNALIEPMQLLFMSCVTLWVVVTGLKLVMAATSPIKIIQEFFFIAIASVLFSTQGPTLVEDIYRVSLLIMGGAAEAALNVAATTSQSSSEFTGMVALVERAEKSVSTVFTIAANIATAGSALNPILYVYAIILVVPYFLLIVVYFAQVVVAIFRVMMIATLAPFLFLAFAFGWGRAMALSGVRTLISTIIVLFACTAAVSVTIYGVNGLNLENTDIPIEELASITNARFLLILALGWLGTAFLAEATSIANSIAGTLLSNTAAGIITAGTVGTALAVAKGTSGSLNPMSIGARYAGFKENLSNNASGLKELGSDAADLIKKFKGRRPTGNL
jgi:hypothetical protein